MKRMSNRIETNPSPNLVKFVNIFVMSSKIKHEIK